jgi:hypothetical protein
MLNYPPFALLLSRDLMAESRSALPNAPVVLEPAPAVARPRTYRTRVALASGFARLADAVGPVDWAPSR